jgi:hypothetical protein
MKKLTLCIITACLLLLTFQPAQSVAATVATQSSKGISTSAEARTLLLRLNEINEMDKKGLSSTDKKNLRTEVISIKHQLKSMDGGGIYLSAGALILIVILLIILL